MKLRRLLLFGGAGLGGICALAAGAMFALGVDPLLVVDKLLPVPQVEGSEDMSHAAAGKPGHGTTGSEADHGGDAHQPAASHAADAAPADPHASHGAPGATASDAASPGHAKPGSAEGEGHDAAHAEGKGDAHGGTAKAERGDHPATIAHEGPEGWAEKLPPGENQPWAVLRRLQFAQDAIVAGRPGALEAYRTARAEAAAAMEAAPPEAWKSRRNVLSAATLTLAGGNPALGRRVLAMLPADSDMSALLEASIAYAEGDYFAAYPAFDRLDPDNLPASVAGQVALVKAMLLSQGPAPKAIEAFNKARLLAPNTLVEEAALRRLMRTHVEEGNQAEFMHALSVYLRRFPKSAYLEDFLRNGATGFVRMFPDDPAAAFDRIYARMDELDTAPKRMFLTLVARTAVIFGHTDLARHAGEAAIGLGSGDDPRLRLYLAASKVKDPAFGREVGALSGEFDATGFNGFDRRLWNAVKLVAEQIDTPLPRDFVTGPPMPVPVAGNAAAAQSAAAPAKPEKFELVLTRAKDMLRQADEALLW